VLDSGQLARLDADTDGDRRPDVVQVYEGGGLLYQDEDTTGDGIVDQRFQGTQAVEVPAGTRIAGAGFESLDCGDFDGFWREH
jgi:hypothetical protein